MTKNPDVLLRTHTSSIQVRAMEKEKPPIRIIAPGRVFRNEAISARAHCIFHQIEGLYIDKQVSFADLKQVLYHFVQEFLVKIPRCVFVLLISRLPRRLLKWIYHATFVVEKVAIYVNIPVGSRYLAAGCAIPTS